MISDPVSSNSLTLEQLAAHRGVPYRDCRTCPHFGTQDDGLAYGWCKAHAQFVKAYHPHGEFWSQCQFKSLTRERGPLNAPAA
jgi:hypothetical protein